MIEHLSDAVIHQGRVFVNAVLWGILLVFSYDCIRMMRRVWHCKKRTAAVQDILFWILWALLIYALLYRYDYGAIRSYTIVGMALGMYSYHRLISRWLVEHASAVLKTIKNRMMRPFCRIYDKIHRSLIKMRTKCKKKCELLIKGVEKSKKTSYNKTSQETKK